MMMFLRRSPTMSSETFELPLCYIIIIIIIIKAMSGIK